MAIGLVTGNPYVIGTGAALNVVSLGLWVWDLATIPDQVESCLPTLELDELEKLQDQNSTLLEQLSN